MKIKLDDGAYMPKRAHDTDAAILAANEVFKRKGDKLVE